MTQLRAVERDNLAAVIESILFVAEEPVDTGTLAKALRRSKNEVERGLAALDERLAETGLRLQRANDQVQIVSAPENGPYVERFLGLESKARLTGPMLESLAIIAYRQPVTRAGVEAVRGVNSDGPIASLIARGLIEEVGKAPGPTLRFLEHFGLRDARELPPLVIPDDDGDVR
jgi:segregation and condensation protein B